MEWGGGVFTLHLYCIRHSVIPNWGNYVTLRHGNYHVSYCHLSSIIVRKGESVFPGIIVGVTGNTGRSTGSHLHLTCKKDGKSINPAILFTANSSPL